MIIDKNNNYQVKNLESKENFPLLFFHFSGFDPFNPTLINRRHPKYNTDVYPSYIPLFEEYVKGVNENGYDRFSKMEYSFNSFEDRESILPLHRRLFRAYSQEYADKNLFAVETKFYSELSKRKLLTGVKTNSFSTYSVKEKGKKQTFLRLIMKCFSILKLIIGVRYYFSLLLFLNDYTRFERQGFLLGKDDSSK